MNIAVISFRDKDVTAGIEELIEAYKEESPTLLLSALKNDKRFSKSVLNTASKHGVKVICFFENALGFDQIIQQTDEVVLAENPVKDILNRLKVDDSLAIVWDDSLNCHAVVHAVEDLALDMWNIRDGMEELEIDEEGFLPDEEELHKELIATMGKFVDLMCSFVASTVMSSLSQAIVEQLQESIEDVDKKDIDPFDNLG